MGQPGPLSHSRLGTETETALCAQDREKTKRGLECMQEDLWKILHAIRFKNKKERKRERKKKQLK